MTCGRVRQCEIAFGAISKVMPTDVDLFHETFFLDQRVAEGHPTLDPAPVADEGGEELEGRQAQRREQLHAAHRLDERFLIDERNRIDSEGLAAVEVEERQVGAVLANLLGLSVELTKDSPCSESEASRAPTTLIVALMAVSGVSPPVK